MGGEDGGRRRAQYLDSTVLWSTRLRAVVDGPFFVAKARYLQAGRIMQLVMEEALVQDREWAA